MKERKERPSASPFPFAILKRMCNRFGLRKEDQKILGERFSLFKENPDLLEVSVGSLSIGIALNKETHSFEAKKLRFGLPSFEKPLYNARYETVEEKISFRRAYLKNKAIFPASYFYEKDKKGFYHLFSPKDDNPFYLAGFYEGDYFCLLTKEGEGKIHRLPLLLPSTSAKAYLLNESKEKILLSSLSLSSFEEERQ